MLGEETLVYGASDYLLTSIGPAGSLSDIARLAEEPYLSMAFQIDTTRLPAFLDAIGPEAAKAPGSPRGMTVSKLTPILRTRRFGCCGSSTDRMTSRCCCPLIEQELLYRLLLGPHGARLRQMATTESSRTRSAARGPG